MSSVIRDLAKALLYNGETTKPVSGGYGVVPTAAEAAQQSMAVEGTYLPPESHAPTGPIPGSPEYKPTAEQQAAVLEHSAPNSPYHVTDSHGAPALLSPEYAEQAKAQAAAESAVKNLPNSPLSNEAVRARQAAQNEQSAPQQQLMGGDSGMGGPEGLLQYAQSVDQTATAGNERVAREQAAAAGLDARYQTDVAAANAPAEKELHDHMVGSMDHLAGVQKEVEAQQTQAIANYTSVQDEMGKMAVEQPKDIFGQAGVNGILGRVALFLGGAGMNGNHANHNLEAINAMADRNMVAQRQRFEQLNRVGQGQNTIYGMLQQKLQNTTAVEATMRNMYLDVYGSNLKMTANKYAGQKAQVDLQKQLALVDQQKVNNNNVAHQAFAHSAGIALQIAGTQQASRTALAIQQLKMQAKQDEATRLNSVGGLIGAFNPTAHERIAKKVGGARTMIAGLNDIKEFLSHKPSIEQWNAYKVQHAINFAAARNFFETGTKIEGGEQSVMDTVALGELGSFLKMVEGNHVDIMGLNQKIEDINAALTQAAYTDAQATLPSVKFDSNDPLWGHYNPATYRGSQRLEAAKVQQQAAALASLPAYARKNYVSK